MKRHFLILPNLISCFTLGVLVSCGNPTPPGPDPEIIITPTINCDSKVSASCSVIKMNQSFSVNFEINDNEYIISSKSYIKIGSVKKLISTFIQKWDTNIINVPSDLVNNENIEINLSTIKKDLNILDGSEQLNGLTSIASHDEKAWVPYFGDWKVTATLVLDNHEHTQVDKGIKIEYGVVNWSATMDIGTYEFYVRSSITIDSQVYESQSKDITLTIEQDMDNLPLNITAIENSKITLETDYGETTPSPRDLKYSTDLKTWIKFPDNGVDLEAGNTIYLKGDNEWGWSYIGIVGTHDTFLVKNTFKSTGKFNVSGNVSSLVDNGRCVRHTAKASCCFAGLFEGSKVCSVDKKLLSRFDPNESGTFEYMFKDCQYLTQAPDLPFIDDDLIGEKCYYSMFENCDSLECAPDLNALIPGHYYTGNVYCYSRMFYDCNNLKYLKVGIKGNFNDSIYKCSFVDWVGGDNFSKSGDFYYAGSDSTRSDSAIPEGWVVHSQW